MHARTARSDRGANRRPSADPLVSSSSATTTTTTTAVMRELMRSVIVSCDLCCPPPSRLTCCSFIARRNKASSNRGPSRDFYFIFIFPFILLFPICAEMNPRTLTANGSFSSFLYSRTKYIPDLSYTSSLCHDLFGVNRSENGLAVVAKII